MAQFFPRQWVPISSPPTTPRDTVEVFEPASTRGSFPSESESKLLHDWQFIGNHDGRLFQPNHWSRSSFVTSSRTRRWICLLWICLTLSSVRIAHVAFCWKSFHVQCIQVLSQSRLCKADHAYRTYLMLQRQLSHLNCCKLGYRQVEIYYIFMSGYVLCYTANMFIIMIYMFSVCCVHNFFLYNRIHTEGLKPCANREPMCTLDNFQWCREPCYVRAAILRGRCMPLISRRGKRTLLVI
jgi:hypothetical protein